MLPPVGQIMQGRCGGIPAETGVSFLIPTNISHLGNIENLDFQHLRDSSGIGIIKKKNIMPKEPNNVEHFA